MIVPWNMIASETLKNLIETTVSSEGTDNGDLTTLDDKVGQVMKQLASGEAFITFDEETHSFSITSKESLTH